ncbi:hypothetical protein BT63DRAFT_444370 [Microthyrium microscopicum]|uniref:Uncharacterized protein n=1 Tax=Microthyrium microscopicum TaxID=703497 RepID=A0A6A6TWT4_9PEZI|nr:hypothetical protein BT63DRAFT_444370 [Microthyrium microscopicum]
MASAAHCNATNSMESLELEPVHAASGSQAFPSAAHASLGHTASSDVENEVNIALGERPSCSFLFLSNRVDISHHTQTPEENSSIDTNSASSNRNSQPTPQHSNESLAEVRPQISAELFYVGAGASTQEVPAIYFQDASAVQPDILKTRLNDNKHQPSGSTSRMDPLAQNHVSATAPPYVLSPVVDCNSPPRLSYVNTNDTLEEHVSGVVLCGRRINGDRLVDIGAVKEIKHFWKKEVKCVEKFLIILSLAIIVATFGAMFALLKHVTHGQKPVGLKILMAGVLTIMMASALGMIAARRSLAEVFIVGTSVMVLGIFLTPLLVDVLM